MVLPRESAAVSLKYRRWDLNPHPLYEDRILSPARLPSPSHWKQVAVVLKVCESKARTSPPWSFRIVAAWG